MATTHSIQLEMLEPDSCAGCGLCCWGVGSPVEAYLYRTSHSGGYLLRPRGLPVELVREIEAYVSAIRAGAEPLPHCLWLDPETGSCKHHEWRPQVCRDYPTGGAACLDERRPHVKPRGESAGG